MVMGLTSVLDGGNYLVSRCGYFTLGEQHNLHVEFKDVWPPEQVCRFWRREKSPVPAQNRTNIPLLSNPYPSYYTPECVVSL
jgi:hypothetical protein